MRLFLVQHGEAVPEDVDPDRPLNAQGRADIQRLAEWLVSHNVKVSRILHSGKTRARQTAELLRPLLPSSSRIYEGQGLAPNDSPESFLHQLKDQDEDILIAGHMPFVARCVSQALTGAPDRQLVEFLPGTVAGIQRGDGASWHLFMFSRPESFHRAGVSQAVY
jgi:phosphohistidine phosphatase